MTADLYGQLEEASEREAVAFEAKEFVNSKLSAAVAAQDYALAEDLKGQVPAAELAWVHAKAQLDGIKGAVEYLEAEERRRQEEVDLAEQRRQARELVEDAILREQQAKDDLAAAWADVQPCIDAAREKIRQAVDAEQRVNAARWDAHRGMVTLGERAHDDYNSSQFNHATQRLAENPLLKAIQRGHL